MANEARPTNKQPMTTFSGNGLSGLDNFSRDLEIQIIISNQKGTNKDFSWTEN